MIRRAFPLLLLLAGCHHAARVPAGGDRIACALPPAGNFEKVCTAERDGDRLLLRRPDGGFRQLVILHDGHGVAAADGAEPARVSIAGPGLIEVAIGAGRYRLPATVASVRR